MDLHQALQRASGFAGKDDLSAFLRVFPAYFSDQLPIELVDGQAVPHVPARVLATKDDVHAVWTLDRDVDVPPVAPEAATLKRALAPAKKQEFRLIRLSDQVTVLGVSSSSGVAMKVPSVRAEDRGPLPFIPEVMRPFPEGALEAIGSLLHAAVKRDPDRSNLECIHITPWWVEATDQARAARAKVDGLVQEPVLVPRAMFEKLPKDDPKEYALTSGFFCLRCGDEYRVTTVRQAQGFYDLTPLFRSRAGTWGFLSVTQARVAVKAAQAVSPIGVVEVLFGGNRCSFCGILDDGSSVSVAELDAIGCVQPGRFVGKAHLLADALKARDTAVALTVAYAGPSDPLRMEQGGAVEFIWGVG